MTVQVVAARLPGENPHASQYKISTPVLRGDFDYWKALHDVWYGPDTLVNVEHDMEFSDELVQGLLDCPHPLCTYPYLCWIRERGHYVYTPTADGRWVSEGRPWADTSTLGFVKIAPEARVRPLRRMIWKFLEHSVCIAVAGFSQVEKDVLGNRRAWHVHWPAVKHFHDYDLEAQERMSDWERFCAEHGEPCRLMPSEARGDIRSVRLDPDRVLDVPIGYRW